jgi:hypothetical protein
MVRQHMKLVLRTTAIAMAAGWLCLQPLASTAVAATLTPQQVSQFEANPAAALAQYSNSAELVSFIRDLMLTDPATLNPIIGLIPTAKPEQQTAIGTGLGQAAQALVRTNPALANLIQQSLIACGSGIPQPDGRNPCENAVLAYAGVTGNAAITAAGGGGGGGGGGAGVGPVVNGPPLGGSNAGTGPQGTGPVTNPGFSIVGGSVSGSGGTTTTTTVTTTSTSAF